MTKSNADVQKIFLDFIVSNGTLYTRVQNIFNPENFDRHLRGAAKFIHGHAQQHSAIPSIEQIKAVSGLKLDIIENILQGHIDWFLEEFEQFTRIAELERAILKSADLLEKGDFGPVEKLIKDAVQISLTRDLGIDYFHDPRARLLRLKESNGQVSTGWSTVDKYLYGGFNRGELEIFSGGPGAGKSVVLQNLACNWIETGLNGIYVTLELSQDLTAMRLDSMLTGIGSREIFKNLDDVELKVAMLGKKSGRLKIKFLPAGSTVNDLRAYVRELMIQENYQIDFILVDYLDLMMPSGAKVDLSDMFIKDKLLSEELRNFFIELNSLGVSASQLNRSSFDEIEFNLGNVAGGISKANSCDNMFGIFTTRTMKERGKIQFQFMKTRNSSGVGNKVDMDFNVDSLRITDSSEGENTESTMTGSNILSQIKNGPKVSNSPQVSENKKDLMKNLLASISKSNS